MGVMPAPELPFAKQPPGGCLGGPMSHRWAKMGAMTNRPLKLEHPHAGRRVKARVGAYNTAVLLTQEAVDVALRVSDAPPFITPSRFSVRPNSAPAVTNRAPHALMATPPPLRPQSARESPSAAARRVHVYPYRLPGTFYPEPIAAPSPAAAWVEVRPQHIGRRASPLASPRAPPHRMAPEHLVPRLAASTPVTPATTPRIRARDRSSMVASAYGASVLPAYPPRRPQSAR